MEFAAFVNLVVQAIDAIFGVGAGITADTKDVGTLHFVVENPTSNPDFVWDYELNVALVEAGGAGGEEYRASAVGAIANRVQSDLLQQWLNNNAGRPVEQPIDRI